MVEKKEQANPPLPPIRVIEEDVCREERYAVTVLYVIFFATLITFIIARAKGLV